MSTEKIYYYKDIEISYIIDESNENYFYKFEPFIEKDKICFIELVQNISEEYGKGEGSEAMKNFLEELSLTGIKNFYLFVSYDNCYYEKNEKLKGLYRLIDFYEKFGFKTIYGRPSNYQDQVDMYLELN